jgi:hypothetical protein
MYSDAGVACKAYAGMYEATKHTAQTIIASPNPSSVMRFTFSVFEPADNDWRETELGPFASLEQCQTFEASLRLGLKRPTRACQVMDSRKLALDGEGQGGSE